MTPTAGETYRILALTYAEQGNLSEAERVAREAVELPAAGSYTLATLGFVLGRAGKPDAARAVLTARRGRSVEADNLIPPLVDQLATALRDRGLDVVTNVGQSAFRCDLAVRSQSSSLYQLGILVDTDGHYANPNLLDRYLMQPGILRAFGWRKSGLACRCEKG